MASDMFLDVIEPELRARLDSIMKVQNFPKGNMVISHQDVSDDVFFVLTGRARATVHSADGKMVSFRDIEAGSMFGELSAIDQTPRSASVIAQEDLSVGRLSGKEFRTWIESDPTLMWAVMRYLTSQCRRMTDRIFEYSTMLVKDRLVNELVRMAKAVSGGKNTAIIAPAPTHFDLASSISTHREAVSREMSLFAKQQLVVKKHDGLHVTNIEALSMLTKDV